jgi:hypothetical protein
MFPKTLHDDWTSPPELERPLPRPVRITGLGVLGLAFCLFFMAPPAFIIVAALRDDARAASYLRQMAAEGRETDAVITRLWVSHGSKGSTTWHVAYEYDVDGRTYRSQNVIAPSHWHALRVRGRLPVGYLASDPSRVYPAADPPRRTSPLLWGFVAVFTGLFAAIGVAGIAGVLRSRKLLAEGLPARGRVTSCKRMQSRSGVSYFIRYEFTVMDGTTCQGKGTVRSQAAEGSSITVLYDPNLPRRNATYPMTMARLAEQ